MTGDIYVSGHELLASGRAVIGIVGLGYVGLPLAVEFSGHYRVIGYDAHGAVVEGLAAGASHVDDISDGQVASAVAGNFRPTSDPADLAAADFIIVCVPTPLREDKTPDLSYIEDSAAMVAKILRRGQFVILESTTYPGTTGGPLRRWLEAGSGLEAGEDFGLAFSPERIDPGNKKFTVTRIPKVVGGLGQRDTEVVATLYEKIIEAGVVRVKDSRTAEAVKLMENIFRHVNIALANEMALVMEKMDINVWEVIDAAATKPYGYMPFYPGPGVGGHCIPLDPYYLSFAARQKGIMPQFIELSGEINDFMAVHVVNMLEEGLASRGRGMDGSVIGILGLAYKKNISDLRESPAFRIIEDIAFRGGTVRVHDPHAGEIKTGAGTFVSESDPAALFRGADAVAIVTDHDEFRDLDYNKCAALMRTRVIVDARNTIRDTPGDAACGLLGRGWR